MLLRYQDKEVRITTEDGSVFTGTAEVFLSSGMHCIGCPVSRGETIEEASLVHGLDADRLVEKLNDYLEGKK